MGHLGGSFERQVEGSGIDSCISFGVPSGPFECMILPDQGEYASGQLIAPKVNRPFPPFMLHKTAKYLPDFFLNISILRRDGPQLLVQEAMLRFIIMGNAKFFPFLPTVLTTPLIHPIMLTVEHN